MNHSGRPTVGHLVSVRTTVHRLTGPEYHEARRSSLVARSGASVLRVTSTPRGGAPNVAAPAHVTS